MCARGLLQQLVGGSQQRLPAFAWMQASTHAESRQNSLLLTSTYLLWEKRRCEMSDHESWYCYREGDDVDRIHYLGPVSAVTPHPNSASAAVPGRTIPSSGNIRV